MGTSPLRNQMADPVFDLSFSPDYANDKICFAARQSGLYRSEDGGRTWKNTLASLELSTPLAISCVVLAPNFAEMSHVFAAGPGGILRSLDGGKTWYVTMLPSPPPFITGLAVSPNYSRDGIIFACSFDDGIFRSSDRGASWKAWNFGLFDLHILSIVISPNFAVDQNVFLGTESGMFRSVNGGLGWREVEFSVEHAPVLSLAISPNFAEDNTFFAGTESAGLFRSNDRGKNWVQMDLANLVGSINAIALLQEASNEVDILLMGSETLHVSYDSGKTWKKWDENLQYDDQLLCMAIYHRMSGGFQVIIGLVNGKILHI